ncbi:hypothetical protein HT121_10385 [Pseudomonas sp. MAFF 301514]|uniref:Uncharacterized protein n=1 Tax=Pseudomonas allii TaxID=2740531 RepID=A0A7Y8UZM3_9PSED|nr:hypothetical protein [Pseudomonas allii]NWN48004.1 hypothetical protein [Pseudomonas allii]NWN64193.1 hypothetical protein [Pseudomonas allii]
MKEITAAMFDIIALSLPRGLGFGDNPPVNAWLSDDGISCAVLTQNVCSGCAGTITMRRRVDSVWVLLNRTESWACESEARAAIEIFLDTPAHPIPLVSGERRRPRLTDIGSGTPSGVFKSLFDPRRRIGAWMLNQLYLALPAPDLNWATDCQTENFHTRLWEAHLLAIFREQGLKVTQPEPSPDFHIANCLGGEAWVEAVTANPQERYEHFRAKPVPPPSNSRERFLGAAAERFARTIKNKLEKRYETLKHVEGKPFILALADFHAPSSMLWSRESLISYLYDVSLPISDSDGVQVASVGEVNSLLSGRPSGLFRFKDNAHLSAVIFTNACTVSKLSRVPISGGAHLDGYRYIRFGEFFNRSPGASRGIPFLMDIASTEYGELWPQYGYEPWSAEVEVFHNPLAVHPVPNELLPEATHWRETNRGIECQSYFEIAILRSKTVVLSSESKMPTLEELLAVSPTAREFQ